MNFLREHGFGLFILLAIVGSFVVGNAESHARDHAQHVQIVHSCERGSEKTALTAAYQHATAEARRSAGDKAIAEEYDGFAKSSIDLIPVPRDIHPGDPAMVAVVKVPLPHGQFKFRLSDRAKALQAAGCERVNA